MKRTPWFAARRCAPLRAGWYEIRTTAWKAERFYFCDGLWHAWQPKFRGDGCVLLGVYKGDAWRGLNKEAA